MLIKCGKLVDGTGNPWYIADVGIRDGKIAKIGRNLGEAKHTVDASGKIVAPGFIDTHTHSDFTLLQDPRAISKVHQGVTTEIVGNCGGWIAPITRDTQELVSSLLPKHGDIEIDWTGIGGYLDRLQKQKVALNVGALVGFANVRAAVMGLSRDAASDEQIAKMRGLVEENIEQGAFGLSTGLFYAPQSYAAEHEVTEVVRALKKHDALYVTHIRDEGNYTIGLKASLEEAFRTQEDAGVMLHISHLQANGVAAWGSGPDMVETIERRRAIGMDVTCDVYPYDRCGGGISGSVMPRWALEGGRNEVLKRLRDPATRAKIAHEIKETFKKRGGAELHTFSSVSSDPHYEGKTLDEVARDIGESPEFAVLTLLERGEASWVSAILHSDDVASIMKADWAMVGSDGSSLALSGPVSGGKPHPRNFGSFPRVLRHYCLDSGLLSLEQAVRKMTSLAAQRFGLVGRGLLKEGFYADTVIFDPNTIRDTATFQNPHSLPEGITHVMVNGEFVVSDSKHTGTLPGLALRNC